MPLQNAQTCYNSGMVMWILIAVVAVIVLWAIFSYNRLVTLVQRSKEAWADIDVQLKRRYDLIPNLVETVKGYAAHEKGVFENVATARAAAMDANGIEDRGKAENALSNTLKSLFAVAEAYPDLKANQNFLALQQQLTDTEDKIQAARRFYNGNVRDLNTAIARFPSNVIADIFRFEPREFFELGDTDAAAREPVQVKF